MGSLRKIRRQTIQIPQKQLVVVKTDFVWNGTEVCLLLAPTPDNKNKPVEFRKFMEWTIRRAFMPNIRDMFKFHFQMLEKINNNEKIILDDKDTEEHN